MERCEFIPGSFFESIPSGYDAYVLKYIIHDWSDDRALTILRNCRNAMSPGARLLLIEIVNSPASATDIGAVSDLEMLVLLGGRERTIQEFALILADAGLRLNRVIPTRSPLSILEAIAAAPAQRSL